MRALGNGTGNGNRPRALRLTVVLASGLILLAGVIAPAAADSDPGAYEEETSPTFTVFWDADDIEGIGWTANSSVTITIDDDQDPVSVLFTYEVFTDETGFFRVSYPDAVFDVEAGHYVVVTDGAFTKDHRVTNMRFGHADINLDLASGTADAGSEVEVVIHGGPLRVVSADEFGNWTADFSVPWEGHAVFDINLGTGGFDFQFDEDGDATGEGWEVEGPPNAVPLQWRIEDGGNGHWYRLSPRPVDGLDDAIQVAAESTWLGRPGYVVSVLSEGEKDFLVDMFGSEALYLIGYTDRDEEGVWEWVSGETSGFTFWASEEPNNANEGEDIAVMNWQHGEQSEPQPPGAWNDLGSWSGHAIFEYDGDLGVAVDIKPRSDINPVNLKSNGVIPVAILTTADFDATTVDPMSAAFGPAGASKAHRQGHFIDVDYDGDIDLMLHFRTKEAGIQPGDAEACLTAQTFEGLAIVGCDLIATR